jgi:hypothetical protein
MGPPYIPTSGIFTAFAGGLQPLATLLDKDQNAVDTVVSPFDSCKLPPAVVGSRKIVANYGANVMDLYPATGEYFYGFGINVPLPIGVGSAVNFFCYTNGEWR